MTSQESPLKWKKAAGHCGFNTRETVEAAYESGIALFAFKSVLSTPGKPRYFCVVAGYGSVAGHTLADVKSAGEAWLLRVRQHDSGRGISHQMFTEMVRG